MLAPYRTLTADDIRQRGFGESCYSDRYASERASQLQARDLVDLQNSIINRKNHTAAEILTKGGYVIEGLADDGSTVRTDTIAFDWDGKIGISSAWSNPGALIYHDIEAASDFVQERAGQVPKIMMCGGNIAKYLFNNDNILKHLNVPSRDNLSLFNFNPQIVSNQVQRIGYIQALGLEIYSYKETYKNDNGETVPFLDPDAVIIGIGGLGNQLHGAVDLVNDNGEFETFISPYIPRYIADKRNNQMTVTLYSRFIMAPDTVDSWAYINAKGV